MRRLVLCGTLIVLVLASRQASAQTFGGHSGDDAERHDHQHHDRHHHHHHDGPSGWRFDPGFPWIGGGGYPPVFQPYYAPYPYFGYSVVLPRVVLNPAPARVARGPANQ